MLTVAYLANQYPVVVEPYVDEEIEALRRHGVRVITGTVSRVQGCTRRPDIALRPVRPVLFMRALWLCVQRWSRISSLVVRGLLHGTEGPLRRIKSLLHTLLGACYAVELRGYEVDHLHVHHGFSAAWVAMIASRLLGVDFSMTLHGSDLLLHRVYLDVKLENCKFCLTISEYNRTFLLQHYPAIPPSKVFVTRLGVEIPEIETWDATRTQDAAEPLRMLAVGRLHAVKNHAFLIQACARLRVLGMHFCCKIAGEGPEHPRLESLVRGLRLENNVLLLGHSSREQIDSLYREADLLVLTSLSEGLPLVLMEAMARAKIVLAPAITGIPELVVPGKTGLLYEPGSMTDFTEQVIKISSLLRKGRGMGEKASHESRSRQDNERALRPDPACRLDWIRHAARVQVSHNFNKERNLQFFVDLFLRHASPSRTKDLPYACSVLQQI